MSTYKTASYNLNNDENDIQFIHFKLTTELAEDLENAKNLKDFELIINNKDSTGTLNIPVSKSQSKNFEISLCDLTDEISDVGKKLNSNLVRLGRIAKRYTVKATIKSYDITKKKISNIEDEARKHTAKEIKLNTSTNSKKFAYNKNKNSKYSIVNSNIKSSTSLKDNSIRTKIIHFLAVKPLALNTILLMLNKYGVTSKDRPEINLVLKQISTINRNNEYVLSTQFFSEVNENWENYSDSDRMKVISFKKKMTPSLTDSKTSGISNEKRTISLEFKIKALDMHDSGMSIEEISSFMNVPEPLLNSWIENSFKLRQNYEIQNSGPTKLQEELYKRSSPVLTTKRPNEDINRTPLSQDEAFDGTGVDKNSVSAVKSMSSVPSSVSNNITNKHVIQSTNISRKQTRTLTDSLFDDTHASLPKRAKTLENTSVHPSGVHPTATSSALVSSHAASNVMIHHRQQVIPSNSSNQGNNSSSSCEVTPKSELSPLSNKSTTNTIATATINNPPTTTSSVSATTAMLAPTYNRHSTNHSSTPNSESRRKRPLNNPDCKSIASNKQVLHHDKINNSTNNSTSLSQVPPNNNKKLSDKELQKIHHEYDVVFEEYQQLKKYFDRIDKQIDRIKKMYENNEKTEAELMPLLCEIHQQQNSPKYKHGTIRLGQLETLMTRYITVIHANFDRNHPLYYDQEFIDFLAQSTQNNFNQKSSMMMSHRTDTLHNTHIVIPNDNNNQIANR